MKSYDALIPALKRLLSVPLLSRIGREVSFIRRLREIRSASLVWAVVLSRFGAGTPGFEQARGWYAKLTNKRAPFPRPFQIRFKTPAAVRLFSAAFDAAVAPWRQPRSIQHPLARKFSDVVLCDSTMVQVTDALRRQLPGGRKAKAALKIGLAVSLFGLVPLWAQLVAATVHDMKLFPPLKLFAKRTLFLFDKGYVAFARLREITEAGLFFVCPMRQDGNPRVVGVHDGPLWLRKQVKASGARGVPLRDLLRRGKRINRVFDLAVTMVPRKSERIPVRLRLVILPGPDSQQRPYLTNLERAEWAPRLFRELYRLRWQIELVFKELKQHLNLTALPSKNVNAVKVFAWASLIALALSRVIGNWLCPLSNYAGLRSGLNVQIVTRALRSSMTLLHAVLRGAPSVLRPLLTCFADALLAESRRLRQQREDSLFRLQNELLTG